MFYHFYFVVKFRVYLCIWERLNCTWKEFGTSTSLKKRKKKAKTIFVTQSAIILRIKNFQSFSKQSILFLMLLEVKLFVRLQDKASKDTFSSDQKLKNVTRGGGRGGVEKCRKKCHGLFEWPQRTKNYQHWLYCCDLILDIISNGIGPLVCNQYQML